MQTLEKLNEIFEKFPGIGPRQASRFVYFLLRQSHAFRKDLSNFILSLDAHARKCDKCFRFMAPDNNSLSCSICANTNRENKLMVVEKDIDIDAFEKSGSYSGKYFVLGGTRAIATDKPPKNENFLIQIVRISKEKKYDEIILALSATPDGEYTEEFLHAELLSANPNIKITKLGRGLSTGSELEYADPNTLKNAFRSRA